MGNNERPTQREQIRDHLLRCGSITPLTALREYGCMRLGARILELRRAGMNIKTRTPAEGKRFAIYELNRHQQMELAI